MPPQQKAVSGPAIIDIASTELTEEDVSLIRHPATAGIILFSRNIHSLTQTKVLCQQLRAVREDLLICIDQEGGRVQRLTEGVTRIPPMAAIGRVFQQSPQQGLCDARAIGWLMARELKEVGVDLSLAPVLDLDTNICPAIGNRSFGLEPNQVSALSQAFVEGMKDAGMGSVGKHFPGHGKVSLDSHFDLPRDMRSLEELWQDDLLPFRALTASSDTSLSGVMPAHIVFEAIDDKPVGFSEIWLKTVLRQKLGFDGLIFSDDLSMAAAEQAGAYPARVNAALKAGCDLVLVCNNREAAREVLNALTVTMTTQQYQKKLQLIEHARPMTISDQQKQQEVRERLLSSDYREY